MLRSAAQPGHEDSALTEVGCCGPPGRVSRPPLARQRLSTNQMHTGGPKSAGNEKAAAKGPARYQDARGPSVGQVTPAAACPWAGTATCRGKCVDTIQQVAWHESGPLRCESNNTEPARSSQSAAETYLCAHWQVPTKPSSPTRIADNNGHVVRWSVCADHERSVRSGRGFNAISW